MSTCLFGSILTHQTVAQLETMIREELMLYRIFLQLDYSTCSCIVIFVYILQLQQPFIINAVQLQLVDNQLFNTNYLMSTFC